MKDQTRAAMDAPMARKADRVPKRRIFMMGDGTPVQPKRVKKFCDSLVEKCLDAKVRDHYDFVLGFAACFDAISRGTIDLSEHPVNVALQAYSDVHNITSRPNKVTNVMKELGE